MSDDLLSDATLNRVRAEAQRVALNGQPLMGTVTSYDPAQYAVKVKLLPEGAFPEQDGNDFETDWIPLNTHQSGQNWGIFAPPQPGTQVHVKFIDGEIGSAVVDGCVFDLTNTPLPTDAPNGIPAAEIWLVSPTGNRFTLANAGDSLTLKHHSGSTVVIDGTADSGNDAITLTHHSGATFTMDKNGNVEAKPKGGGTMTVTAGGSTSAVMTENGPSSVLFADG